MEGLGDGFKLDPNGSKIALGQPPKWLIMNGHNLN
jgi:hypothetical protein